MFPNSFVIYRFHIAPITVSVKIRKNSMSMQTPALGDLAEQVSSRLQDTTCPSHQTISNCCIKSFVSHFIPPRALSFKYINLLSLKRSQTQFQPGVKPSGVHWFNKEGAASPSFNSLDWGGRERKKNSSILLLTVVKRFPTLVS